MEVIGKENIWKINPLNSPKLKNNPAEQSKASFAQEKKCGGETRKLSPPTYTDRNKQTTAFGVDDHVESIVAGNLTRVRKKMDAISFECKLRQNAK